MVFNNTFNNISVISFLSVLLVEETRVPGENHRPAQVTDKLYLIMLYIQYTSPGWDLNSQRTGSHKSNYHTITTAFYYPLANEVVKGYSNATFRNILVNTLESTSFNGF
jgi:hypothetical protein